MANRHEPVEPHNQKGWHLPRFGTNAAKKEGTLVSLLGLATALVSVAICLVMALAVSIYVPTFHLDGAFQTASGLFRLEAGQLPGRDFYPYLGVGPLFAIFPIYQIFGGDLAATVAAAKFFTVFINWMAIAVLWHLAHQPVKVIHSVVGGALILFGARLGAGLGVLPDVLAFGFEPGNSLRPVRAVIPYLVGAIIYLLIKKGTPLNLRNLLISGVLGSTLLWSNDFAIPTFGMFLILITLYMHYFEKNRDSNALILGASSVVIWFLLLAFVTAGHPVELLKYNFLDVAKDQWWYFGPYEPSARIFDANQLYKLISTENIFPIVVLWLVFGVAIKTKLIEYWFIFTIGLTLFAGGSLASVGGHFGGYFESFYFWGIATLLILSSRGLVLLAIKNQRITLNMQARLQATGLLIMGLVLGVSLQDYNKQVAIAQADPTRVYVTEFGAYLDVGFSKYIDYAREHREHTVAEDYWGLWSALNRQFPPWPVDSVIHALGNAREVSRNSLNNAQLVITTRYSTNPTWQPWVLSQNYWFYAKLISDWEPVFTSPTTIVWKRSFRPAQLERAACQVAEDKNSITLPQSEPGLYQVRIRYSSVGGRHLLMFKNNISYGSDAGGFVSLKPGKQEVTIPALLTQHDNPIFNLKIIGEANAEILACTADKILYRNEELLHTGTTEASDKSQK